MSKKIGLIDDCSECPFLIDNEWDGKKMTDYECKKLRLKGRNKNDLYKVCPLPDYDEINYEAKKECIWDEDIDKSDDGFWSWIN